MKKIFFALILFSLAFFAFGCSNTSNEAQENTKIELTDNSEDNLKNIDDTRIENSDENKMTYCYVNFAGTVQEYFFVKDMSLMKTSIEGAWNKVKVNKDLSCAWTLNVDKQCVPVAEAGGFNEITQGWKDGISALGGKCDEIDLDKSVFN
jgi:hypothetical protein